MMNIEHVNILAGDDIDLGIPETVQLVELVKLFFLLVGKVGKILKN